MLEDSLFESQCRNKTGNPVTVTVSAIAHLAMIIVLVLIPLIRPQAITIPPIDKSLLAPRFDATRPVKVFSAQPRIRKSTQADPNILTTPESIPRVIAYVDDPTTPSVALLPQADANSLGSLLRDLVSPTNEAMTA